MCAAAVLIGLRWLGVDDRVVDATIEFERDSTGAVTGLWFQQGGPRQRAVRIR